MTTEEFWEEMRKRKAEDRPMFAHATLKQPQTFKQWNGHGADPEFTEYSLPTGACVIITMLSRFGDVGIRGTKTDILIHGYDARVATDVLSPMYFLPPLSQS